MNTTSEGSQPSSRPVARPFFVQALVGLVGGTFVGLILFFCLACSEIVLLDREITQLTLDQPDELRIALSREMNRYVVQKFRRESGPAVLLFTISGLICSCCLSRGRWIAALGAFPIIVLVFIHGIATWNHYQSQLREYRRLLRSEAVVFATPRLSDLSSPGWRNNVRTILACDSR